MQRSASSCSGEPAKRLRRSIVAASSSPKAGIARVLLKLHEEGLLAEGVIDSQNEDSIKMSLGKAVGEIAAVRTPWGPLVQEMVLATDPPTK